MTDVLIGCTVLGGLFAAFVAWAIFKRLVAALFRAVITSFLPLETKTLEWLQDRAMARALGIDVDVVRMRRRMETLRKPMYVKGANHSQPAASSEGWD